MYMLDTNICIYIKKVNHHIRFINQFSFGCGNYTEERRKTVDTMSLDEIIAGIENMKKQLH